MNNEDINNIGGVKNFIQLLRQQATGHKCSRTRCSCRSMKRTRFASTIFVEAAAWCLVAGSLPVARVMARVRSSVDLVRVPDYNFRTW